MRIIQSDGLTCFQFPSLAKLTGFFHGVFPRRAVDAQGRATAFNLGLGHGSSDTEVWDNRGRMLRFFGSDYCAVYARQVHGRHVAMVRAGHVSANSGSERSIVSDGDALMTDVAGTALVIQVADCQPIIIVDPVAGAVANIHSGWRGSIQNIIDETIDRMRVEYHTRPENLVCGVGPSLGPCCAEFVNYTDEIPETLWRYGSTDHRFDFWQISKDQLMRCGVRTENISLAAMCTKCNQHQFYSYRGERMTGRFAAVIGILSGNGGV